MAEDKAEVVAFLRTRLTEAAPGSQVQTFETHISTVLVGPDRVFKLKKAVRLPYLDFSSPDLRARACEQELALNRRSAPALYTAARRITREADGALAFDGPGPLVDAAVEMVRFEQDDLLDAMAIRGALDATLMTKLAQRVAAFHCDLAPVARSGSAAMAAVLEINERAFARLSPIFEPGEIAALNAAFRAGLADRGAILDARGAGGKIRRGHGDLHLRNICLFGGEPTLFDCLEFDADLATSDILYDLAFLLMDLWHRGAKAAANLVLNRYLDELDETDGLPALPFFMAVRAAVRAHVTAAQALDETGRSADLRAEARSSFGLAQELLRPAAPRLVAVGGLSGSGKSTVAAALAPEIGPPPGARIVASDRLRKRLFQVSALTRLPATAYRPEVSVEVYRTMRNEALRVLRLGHAVVADAVFDRADERAAIAETARQSGVPFRGLWLSAQPDALRQRVSGRRGDPSDATEAVVAAQVERLADLLDWPVVPADAEPAQVFEAARLQLGRMPDA